jgi:Na+/melibiose symporter-like transporter
MTTENSASSDAEKQALSTSAQTSPSTWILLAYGGLALPVSLAGLPILTYLPAFYARELHLSAGLVGVVFLSARLWDGFSDILIGWLSDRSMSRFGRRKPWAIVGAPFLMASTWFLCNPPQGAGLAYLALWAGLFYTAWTAVYIPYVSWGTELSNDYIERSRVTSFRESFNMLGNLFFATGPLLFLAADAPLHAVLFLITVTVLTLTPLTALPLGLFVRDSVPAQRIETNLLKGLSALAKDRVLIRFVAAALCIHITGGVANSLAVFSFSVGLQLPNKLFLVIFIIYVSALSTLPLLMRLGKRVEKHHLLAGATMIQAISYCALIWVPAGNFPIVAAVWIAIGIANSAMMILPTSILADIIDHGEVTEGQRRSGAYVAIYNLLFKVGLALGVGLSFGLLELVHYDPSAAHYSAADARNIRLLGFGLPGAFLIPAAVLLLKHPITKKVQQRLRGQINSSSGEL